VDAGATPSFEPNFTEVQRRDMDDLAKEIETLIAAALESKAKAEEEKSSIKKLEKQLAKEKEKTEAAKQKLDILEFISEKTTGKGSKRKAAPVDAEKVYTDVKAEFDKDLKELGRRHQKAIQEKDKEIEELEFRVKNVEIARKRIEAFREAFIAILPQGTEGKSIATSNEIIREMIQKEIKSQGFTIQGYTVAPMEALALDWQRDAMEKMTTIIEQLDKISIDVLSYLILVDRLETGSSIAKALLGNAHGGSRSTISRAMKPLKDQFLIRATKNGFGQDIEGFVSHHVEYATDDVAPFVERVIEHIRQRRNGADQ
jgi:hypothetical protein